MLASFSEQAREARSEEVNYTTSALPSLQAKGSVPRDRRRDIYALVASGCERRTSWV